MERLTLAALRSDARLYADERAGSFLEDTAGSLDSILHNRIRKVRSAVCSMTGGSSWFDLRETFTTTADLSSYCLDTASTSESAITTYPPTQVREVTINWSTTENERVEQVSEAEFENLTRLTWNQYTPKGCIQRGRYLEFAPTPSSALTCTITYLPDYQELGTADTLYAPEGFGEAVALEAAIQIRAMQDEPIAALKEMRTEAYETLERVVALRAPTFGPRVLNVRPEGPYYDDPDQLLPPA